MDFTSLNELPQLETPVIIRLARRCKNRAQSPIKGRPAIMRRTQPDLQPTMLDLSTKPRETKLKIRLIDAVQQVGTSSNLLNGIEPSSVFGSITFNSFQHAKWRVSTFNITWYTVQHLLNSNRKICCSPNVEPIGVRASSDPGGRWPSCPKKLRSAQMRKKQQKKKTNRKQIKQTSNRTEQKTLAFSILASN